MKHNFNAVITAPVLLSKDLTDREKLIVAIISNLSNEKGYCFASNRYIGNCLSCSEETIRKSLKKLEDLKVINRVIKLNSKNEVEFRALVITSHNLPPVEVPKSEIASSVYSEITDEILSSPSPRDEGDPSPPVIPHNRIYNINNNNNSYNLFDIDVNSKNSREKFFEEKFEQFWDLYDKKVDRETAFRKFKKLKPQEIEKALEAIPIYKQVQPDKKYRKNPATWINGKCWEDEYEPVVTNQNQQDENGNNIRDSFFSTFQ